MKKIKKWLEDNKYLKKIIKTDKEKPVYTMKPSANVKAVKVLWCILIASFLFAVYKNFTAIDVRTVTEKETVELRLEDTNAIENFVTDFAKAYHSWSSDKEELDKRSAEIEKYVTKEVADINAEKIRSDIPTKSEIEDISIWSVTQEDKNVYKTVYSVKQKITEKEKTESVERMFSVKTYVDKNDNMVITQSPTVTGKYEKSDYEPKTEVSDGTIESEIIASATEFLETFFKLYPTATEQELVYYVDKGAMEPVGEDYVFSSLSQPVFLKHDKGYRVKVNVEYLDTKTKATLISQYDLLIEKGDNWKITKCL